LDISAGRREGRERRRKEKKKTSGVDLTLFNVFAGD